MNPEPQKKMPWYIAGKSDIGVLRHTNEDAFFCDGDSGGFFVVADGVGGLEFGERASMAAVAGVKRFFENTVFPLPGRPDFAGLFRDIDAEIDGIGEKLVPGFGIATTLDVAAFGEDRTVHFAHLGDSAIFLLRGNEFVRLTETHTLAAEERARGNHDFPESYENTLTRALGVNFCCEPQVFSLTVAPGDRILTVTDGITRTLSDKEIETFVREPSGTPESIVSALIDAANAAGGYDNSTAVLAFF